MEKRGYLQMKAKKILLGMLFLIICTGLVGAVNYDTNNKVFFYRLNENSGTTAHDELGNYDAEYNSAPIWTNAGGISGFGNYANNNNRSIGADTGFKPTQEDYTNFSLEFRMKTTTTSDAYIMGSASAAHADWKGFSLLIRVPTIRLLLCNGASWVLNDVDFGCPAVNDGNWHHYVLVKNSSNQWVMYRDGVQCPNVFTASANFDSTKNFYFHNRPDLSYGLVGGLDQIIWWDIPLTESQIISLNNSGTDKAVKEVNLISPPDNFISSSKGLNFTANYTVQNYNFDLSNATYYIWDSEGNIFNKTTLEITGEFNETTLFVDNFTLGNYEWNVLACYGNSSYSNCIFDATNNSFFIGASVDAESYNNETYETSLETFEANITLLEGTILYDVGLIYNGTEHSASYSSIDSDSYHLNASFYVPAVQTDTTFSWYWVLYYDVDGSIITQNLTAHSQLVKKIPLISVGTSCSAGFFPAINYSFADAENRTYLTADVTYNFKFGIGNLTSYVVNGEKVNIANLYVCVNQSIDDYKLGYGEIQYEKTGYSARRFYMFEGQSLSNSTTSNHTLYLLPSSQSTSFLIEVKNTYLNPYAEKYVSLLRWYPELNEYRVVEMGRTDQEGKVVMKVHTEDVDYRIGVYELNGSLIKLASPVRMACLVTPCTYSLKIVHEGVDYFYEYQIEGNLSFDEEKLKFPSI